VIPTYDLAPRHPATMQRSRSWLCLAVLLVAVLQLAAASTCAVGDAQCFCSLIKGSWVATPTVIRPTCRKTADVQGNNLVPVCRQQRA
jgi:hypothetical protein